MPNSWALHVLIHSLIATFVTCTPVESHQTLRLRQNAKGVVSGIGLGDDNGDVPVRHEVRDLKDRYPDQWNLYLLGLSSLQWTPQSDPLSYYSLAGIHGRPYQTWGNAPGLEHKLGTSGYCPHSNTLFLGWHRPYLALFEEELYKHVHEFAAIAPPDQAARYAAAAQSFRMPYWDWARGDDTVPDFFTTQRIDVTRTDGAHDSLWNPLYSYYFHPVTPGGFDGKWRNINATLRWPTSDAWDAPSQQSVMLSAFETQKRALHDQVDLSFRASTINEFSKSMETAHGWVHGIIGGGWQPNTFTGQMWPLEYSAFEPLFMLHHTNVDRLFSMYQSTHPERILNPENIGPNGNVFLEDYQIVDGDTQLLPFRKPDDNGFWTTNDVQDTRVFGYAYPETSTGHSAGAAIANLYSSSARALMKSTNITIHTKQAVASENAGALSYASDNTYTDYLIHGSTKTALSTFSATFYFVPTFSPGRDPVEVGSWVNVVMQRPQQELMHANGTISLTSALMDRIANGELESLDTQDVVPYLAAHLAWRIRDGSGNPVPAEDVKNWRFEVRSKEATIPEDENLPIRYSDEEETLLRMTGGTIGDEGHRGADDEG